MLHGNFDETSEIQEMITDDLINPSPYPIYSLVNVYYSGLSGRARLKGHPLRRGVNVPVLQTHQRRKASKTGQSEQKAGGEIK